MRPGPIGPPPGGSDDPGALRGLVSLLVLLAVAGLVWLVVGGPRVPW